jgi:CDP-glucose 4,6-dehydratase
VGYRHRAVEGVVSPDAWRDRSVLVTGHTGFKGAWLTLWLDSLGATVHGLALAPPTDPSLYALARVGKGGDGADLLDVRDRAAVAERVAAVAPEVVFHLAARSLVRPAYADPIGTYEVNVLGTANILEAVRACPSVRAVVVVTSDKVYEPHADGAPHAEDAPLGGVDPYSSSKAGAELVTASYRRSYLADAGVVVATARAGNVIGGGDWAVDRVVPDLLRAREQGVPLELRNPDAVRPWQHVLDPLHGYLALAARLLEDPSGAPEALNFGPIDTEACTVAELVDALTAGFGGGPAWMPAADASPAPETAVLRLDASRARKELGWEPRLDVAEAARWTAEWHLACERGDDARDVTNAQIETYGGVG